MVRSWPRPSVPALPGTGTPPRIYDTVGDAIVDTGGRSEASLYVCGITPYDATHLGHALTYLAFDTLQRVWLDAGIAVHYTQNVTDVDDPLLERAGRDGIGWQELAESQVELFRADMTALRILPPEAYLGVTETVGPIAEAVAELLRRGLAYRVPVEDEPGAPTGQAVSGRADVYFDSRAAERATDWSLQGLGWSREEMIATSAQRGGDPDRAGKRDPLDPLLWRAERAGEPAWDAPEIGRGRPGWHIECSVIAKETLGVPITVQGGGVDLQFPHHAFSDGQVRALTGQRLARSYMHVALLSYRGEKMSKSLGNLEFVSRLLAAGARPGAVRLALLSRSYRVPWEWTPAALQEAEARLDRWTAAFQDGREAPEEDIFPATVLLERVRERLAADLDTQGAIEAVDEAAEHTVDDPALVRALVDALLGVELAG